MKRKMLILVVTIGLIALLALPAWAAYTESQAGELQELYRQKQETELSIVDKQLEMELLTEERAKALKERINEVYDARREAISEGKLSSWQMGIMKRGEADERGFGRKHGGDCPMQGPYSSDNIEDTSVTY